MTTRRFRRVPLGRAAAPWRTRTGQRTVLAVVHNVTSATRLLDVLPLLGSDPRLQFFFTWTKSSVFADGVPELMTALGAIEVPWGEAVDHRFDLAISASYGGDLHRLKAPLLTVSHGMGYNKYFNRKAETERPKPKGRNRKAETRESRERPRRRSDSAGNGCSTRAGRSRPRSSCRIPSSSTG